jgi:hypothetical protein
MGTKWHETNKQHGHKKKKKVEKHGNKMGITWVKGVGTPWWLHPTTC